MAAFVAKAVVGNKLNAVKGKHRLFALNARCTYANSSYWICESHGNVF